MRFTVRCELARAGEWPRGFGARTTRDVRWYGRRQSAEGARPVIRGVVYAEARQSTARLRPRSFPLCFFTSSIICVCSLVASLAIASYVGIVITRPAREIEYFDFRAQTPSARHIPRTESGIERPRDNRARKDWRRWQGRRGILLASSDRTVWCRANVGAMTRTTRRFLPPLLLQMLIVGESYFGLYLQRPQENAHHAFDIANSVHC